MHVIPELAQSHAAILSRQRAQDILCSALVDNCLERYKTVKEGSAKYDWISGQQVGIANLGNSLSVIKRLVFADAQITQPQLAQALAENFAGNDNEQLRQRLTNYAPGYGNDAVGQLLAEAYQACIDELDQFVNTRYDRGPIGGGYYAGTSGISANVLSH